MSNLIHFLFSEYGLQVKNILPAKRGFYGETWSIQTENGEYFVKVECWAHHSEIYKNSLSVVQYMTDRGIPFIPKVIRTKDGRLYSSFQQRTAAVFEYVPGELLETCPVEQLYSHLSEVYKLRTDGIEMETETFGAEVLDTFRNLQSRPELPVDVREALAGKETAVSGYAERLKQLSAVCKGDKRNFHITHGDSGSNCILNGNQLFLVDWDSALLAPAERDAWMYTGDKEQLEKINSILARHGINYRLEQNRLCFYCYRFFFYYLNEHLQAIVSTENEELKAELSKSLLWYLRDGWIYKQLKAAG